LYHCPNDIKYWQEFNLNTLEKIKNFIFNDLWMLWIKDLGYDDFNNNGRTNPNLK
jgi:hypothetical protein